MDISTTFRLTAREYRSAIRNSPSIRVILILSALMVVLSLVSLLSNGPSTVLVLCICLGLLVLTEVTVRLSARRSAAMFAEPWTVRVTSETYSLRTAVSQAEVGWNAYNAAWERSGFWYLRQLNGVPGFVPKRAFDDAQLAQLAEFFTRRLPPPKISWYNPRTWR